MDVVVTPSATRKGVWDLSDRLGRNLGVLTQAAPDAAFALHPEPSSSLANVSPLSYASLTDAMDRISRETSGECELSGDERRTWR